MTRLAAALAFLAAMLTAVPLPAQAQRAPRPVAQTAPPPKPAPAASAPAPAASPRGHGERQPDLAYGAYQRGYFLTAFAEAMKNVGQGDMRAMTLLGELFSNGLGVPQDDAKAAKWYQLAADRGDRDAMFALAIFHMTRRGGLHDRNEAAKLFAAAAKLGHSAAAYDLGLLYLEGQQFPQDFRRAAELFTQASQEGNSEAQYALATLYRDGKGVPLDLAESTRLLGAAALADNVDAQVEYAIALFNGTGLDKKDEVTAAALFRRAALRGSPVAQNRLARLLMAGEGAPANPTEAIKWHLIAKAGGNGDPTLDQYVAKQTPQVRAAAEKAAAPWLAVLHVPEGEHKAASAR
jgi:hypothetical protein